VRITTILVKSNPQSGTDYNADLASFADIMANQLGFKDDDIPLTDQYQADTAHVLALIEGRAQRTQ
jgi:hypothetical protein